MAFLLSGPGIVVRICGLKGSSGKKGCSEGACSASCAVAIRAAVLVVVVIGLTVERRRKGRERDEVRSIEVMIEVILGVEKVERGLIAIRSTLFEGMRGQFVQRNNALFIHTVYRVLQDLSLNVFIINKHDGN